RRATITRELRLSPRARRHAPCYVLHRGRFVMPPRLLSGRWALTPPFHPCQMTHEAPPGGMFSVTLSIAQNFRPAPPRILRGPLPGWCPDVPPTGEPQATAGRPQES